MWTKKFGYIFKNSLKYPWNNFSKMSKLFYTTFAVLFVIHCVESYFVDMTPIVEPFAQMPPKPDPVSSLVHLISGIIGFLVALPLTVSIIRNVVGDEPFYESLFGQIFARRQMRYVLMVIIISLFSVTAFVLFSYGLVALWAENMVWNMLIGLTLIVCFPLFIYVLFRFSLATTLVALDKEHPLETSWQLMKGNILLLLVSSFTLVFLFVMVLMPLVALILIPAAFLPATMFVLINGFVASVSQILIALPLSALAGYFYLAVTNTEAFKED